MFYRLSRMAASSLAVVVTFMMAVLGAAQAGVGYLPGEPGLDHFRERSLTAAHHADAVGFEYVRRALAHVAGEHDLDSHGRELRDDIGFASASGRGHDTFFLDDAIVLIYGEHGEALAMAEVTVHHVID
jgi:hypothetical protein